jgi:two-component system, cell cycle response regulator
MAQPITPPSQCRILIVDDEPAICEFLSLALESRFQITVCRTGTEACMRIKQEAFDVVVVDMRLPDMSGTDVLSFAKNKDVYTEVLIITGYASLEVASAAINLGAAAFIEKPIALANFLTQMEKAVASRFFHLKSISLMQKSDDMSQEFKDHLSDITGLYYFTRKLTRSVEVSEIMRIALEEANRQNRVRLSIIGTSVLGFTEVYAMPAAGEIEAAQVSTLLLKYGDQVFPFIEKVLFREGKIPTIIFKGKEGPSPKIETVRPVSIPMIVSGTSIGMLAVFLEEKAIAETGDPYFLHIVSSVVSPLIEHGYIVQQARQLAKTDGLTGIANHRSFHGALECEIARVNRNGSVFSLVIMDIDDFKVVNDTYGHLVGDAVLKDLVQRVSHSIRTVDIFSRYGGEEFGLILPETELQGAEVVAHRIKKAIVEKPFVYAQHTISYTVSMGIAVYNAREPVKKDVLIHRADAAMYTAKHNGKNRISLSTDSSVCE